MRDGQGRLPSVWRQFDVALAGAVAMIGAFGCLMVYTATRDQLQAQGISPTYYLKKQAIFLIIGLVLMVGVAAVDYRRLRDWALLIYGGTVLVLVAVFAVGHKSRGAQAWFQVGSYQLEPSEFAKIALILALGAYCAGAKGRLTGRALAAVLALSAIPFVLIYKQPDLGSALVLAAVLVAMVLIGGAPARHLALLGVLTVGLSFGVVHFGVLKSYQQARLTSFANAPSQPNAALLATQAGANEYNVAEAKVADSNGGIFGQGIGKGTQTNLSYVPEQRTDFIFTAVAEQLGLVGSAVLLLLFALVIWRTWRAAILSRDLFGTLVCVGVLAMVAFQVFENIGMAVGIMPVAGIPLPLMSYGGSSAIATLAAVGLVLSVRMRRFS
ncbi:MAG TPA: FtsW/RodA/SpoVE family cell cycle protein [Acidimicrobiales bacterium]|nr:FtsW/RodA/SpoVE family cell cycle protein [Acidimicrobiales bacterium]